MPVQLHCRYAFTCRILQAVLALSIVVASILCCLTIYHSYFFLLVPYIQISYRLSHATRSSCPAIDTHVADLRLLHMLRSCKLLPPCLPFLQKKYGDEHRLFVQAMLSASVLSEIEAEETFKRCFHSANVEGKWAKQSFFSSRLLSLWFALQHVQPIMEVLSVHQRRVM